MNLVDSIVANRTISSFPNLSIGTGIMFESIFTPTIERYDNKREIPNKVNINKYSHYAINVITLIRNMLSAITSDQRKVIMVNRELPETILFYLEQELESIMELFEINKVNTKLYFYLPTYKTISKIDNFKKYDDMSLTDKQYYTLISQIKNIIQNSGIDLIKIIDYKLPTNFKTTLITTSTGLDLLNSRRIKLELLESHTGKLKTLKDFYTKYHPIGKKDLSIFPFKEKLLYILGDKYYIKPLSLRVRNSLYLIAETSNWNVSTTDEKIRKDLSKDKDLLKIYDSLRKYY